MEMNGVEKQWKVGGNSLHVHLAWPLYSLIDPLWNSKQNFPNKVPISCCAISRIFPILIFESMGF